VTEPETFTTYKMADGDLIYGEFGWVEHTEFFDDADEPTPLIKEVWVLQERTPYTHHPHGCYCAECRPEEVTP
jgi:hypothetical protein